MLLSEVKKLKVAELRVRLRERGLDSSGLKAELVARLLSAIEAGIEPVKSDEEPPPPPPPPSREAQTPQKSPQQNVASTNAAVTPVGAGGGDVDQHLPQLEERERGARACVDQSTQTENDPTASPSHCLCCGVRGSEARVQEQMKAQDHGLSKEGEEAPSQSRVSASLRVSASHTAQSPPGHEGGVGSACSPLVMKPDCANDQSSGLALDEPDTEVDRQDAGSDARMPQGQRGRDYYEFKEEIQYNRAKTPEPGEVSEDDLVSDDEDVVRLDRYNSDLHFEVGADGSSGQPLLWEQFPLLWSGCRLSHGFTQGKVGFEVKFMKRLSASAVDTSFDPEPHVLRVGWSVDGCSFQLGEEALSFALESTGRVVTGGKAEEFGESFSEGDVIGCYAFISESGEAELSFYKNGRSLGIAFRLPRFSMGGRALYPHVLCKNCSVCLNLDRQGKTWHAGPRGYCPLPTLPSAQWTQAPSPPSHRSECEVLMMVGLPGSGKTLWAQSHMAQNPGKRYSVLSTHSILRCMRLPCAEHKELLLQQATHCLTHLIRTAAKQRRNFILDQANIYQSARRQKMLCFRGYKRRTAVVVVPPDEEWRRRLRKRQEQEGASMPETSLLKAKASFSLPEPGDLLDEVLFVDLGREEAQKLLGSYKEEAGRLLPAPPTRKKQPSKRPRFPLRPQSTVYGRRPLHNRHQFAQHAPRGRQWGCERNHSAFTQPYGCNSDPQRYREYYQPCTAQWNTFDQNQSYYSNHDYYFGN